MTTTLGGTDGTAVDLGRWRTVLAVLGPPGPGVDPERVLLATGEWLEHRLRDGLLRAWLVLRPPHGPGEPATLKFQLDGAAPAVLDRLSGVLRDHGGPGTAVEDRELAPLAARFGGPEGLAVAMDHFVADTRVARGVLATTAGAERLRTAAALLRGSARARTGDRGEQRSWLLRYAAAQAAVPGPLRADLDAARAAARADLAAHRLRGGGGPAADAWCALQDRTWAALRARRDAGALTAEPDTVYGTLVQIAHNLLGLTAQDNARLALVVAARTPHATREKTPAPAVSETSGDTPALGGS